MSARGAAAAATFVTPCATRMTLMLAAMLVASVVLVRSRPSRLACDALGIGTRGSLSITRMPTAQSSSPSTDAGAANVNGSGNSEGDSTLVRWARAHGVGLPSSTASYTSSDECPLLPSLDSIAHLRIALIAVSTHTPLTLNHSLHRWAASGLLDLVDDKLMMLNAAQPAEIADAVAHGFRVVPVTHDTLPCLTAYRMSTRPPAPTGMEPAYDFTAPAWPFATTTRDGRPALRIGMSNWFAFQETDADIVLWLEKDFVPPPGLQPVELARSMLVAAAALHVGVGAVRLRRHDDPDRDGFFDCCADSIRAEYCNFAAPCRFQSHLAWQMAYCAADRVHNASNGRMQECMNEAAGLNQSLFHWPVTGHVDYSRFHNESEATLRVSHASKGARGAASSAGAVSAAHSGFNVRFRDDDQLRRVVPEPLRLQCTSFRFSQ